MKKNLLFATAAMAMASFSVSAQNISFVENAIIEKASEDGRYLVGVDQGTLYFIDVQEETVETYDCGEDGISPYYGIGFGNIFAEDGTMVGNIDFATPAILKNGEWKPLPIKEEDGVQGKNNSADGITPDGKRICGGIAPEAMGMDAKDVMLAPVIWEKGADGEYGMYKKLPYPTEDFTGRLPQYVTARSISDDGKTVIGQVVDWSGFFPMPIVYREQANGEWTYELIGRELVYDVNAVFPAYPSYEPRYPDAADFMNEEEQNAYNEAMDAYNQAVMDYWMGVSDIYPEWPMYENYMGTESAAAYGTAMDTYQVEYAAYEDSVNVFNEVYFDPNVVYNTSYEFNNLAMSRDGKYYATTFHAVDEENSFPDDPWGQIMLSTPLRFNLTNGTYEACDNTDAIVSGFMNDGSMLVASSASAMARTTYIMPAGTTACTSLYDYVLAKNADAAQLLADNLTFQSSVMDWETWESMPGEEGLYTGTASSNGAGNVIYGWLVNEFYGVDWWYLSYCLTFDATTGVVKVNTEGNAMITDISVVDAAGAPVSTDKGSVLDVIKSLGKGVYFVTTTAADGTQKTQKVIRH